MKRKKILWLCSWYPGKTAPFNGDFIQRHARAAAIFDDIYVIHIIGDDSGIIKQKERLIIESPGLTEHIVYYPKSKSFPGRLLSGFKWLFIYKQAIRRYIITYGKPDVVHVTIPVKAGIPGIWMKKRYSIPLVVTEHYGIYNDFTGDESFIKRSPFFKTITKRTIRQADKFISASKYLAEGVNRLVMPKEYEIVLNSVDTDLFFYKAKDHSVFRFIHVSNMVGLKNVEGILEAYKLFIQHGGIAELMLVGGDDALIKRKARELELPGNLITFRGEVPYDRVASEMQQSDCLILFSNIENSPCVIGEALCCGLPVIATEVGGIPELLDAAFSLLVKPKDTEQLADAMHKMMQKSDKIKREKVAADAKNKFSYPVIGKKLSEIYAALFNPGI
jgi:glycosyltransferase involved in cell wall biosynthesis